MRCPKCGNDRITGSGCPRLGFRRYGGKLTPSTAPLDCHRTDAHEHWTCCGLGPVREVPTGDNWFSGVADVVGCGHRWTVSRGRSSRKKRLRHGLR